ncbi:MAG: hypothetical protein KatS3mg108_3176 [Isosphaeraceae bacterium]|jgi:2-keto-4-pentenoate hydratase/2-oxohepta-3-ene-1,7-dioic acid hydratase in catechol pathway|nr:MAG: hypothetical protein KatS3mg108_3176 [Isosphaeraceae bacterium]
MRLCRFRLDDLTLTGFYLDHAVIPIDQASEIAAETARIRPPAIAGSDCVLDYLPPDGAACEHAALLWGWIQTLAADSRAELEIPLEEVELLVPLPTPPKLLLLAGNYPKHVEERGGRAAEREATFPYVFWKPPTTTMIGPGAPIVLPAASPDHIDWEGELGVIIGRGGRAIPESQALEHVAGYTIVNDVSDRRFRPNPGRTPRPRDEHFDWLHGKWHDTFCPCGPCILAAGSDVDPQDLRIRLTVNGATRQDGHTGDMIFPVAAIIAFLSSFMTLEPGDLIATGTPAGVGSARGEYLRHGDRVVVSIDGIGRLENPVVDPRMQQS